MDGLGENCDSSSRTTSGEERLAHRCVSCYSNLVWNTTSIEQEMVAIVSKRFLKIHFCTFQFLRMFLAKHFTLSFCNVAEHSRLNRVHIGNTSHRKDFKNPKFFKFLRFQKGGNIGTAQQCVCKSAYKIAPENFRPQKQPSISNKSCSTCLFHLSEQPSYSLVVFLKSPRDKTSSWLSFFWLRDKAQTTSDV